MPFIPDEVVPGQSLGRVDPETGITTAEIYLGTLRFIASFTDEGATITTPRRCKISARSVLNGDSFLWVVQIDGEKKEFRSLPDLCRALKDR